MIKSASVEELRDWLKSGEAVLVDVREPDEYEMGHIAGAILLPLASVSLESLPPHQGKKLVMQCHLGGRSRTACGKVAQEMSGLEVYNLEGGIHAWQQAGFEVEL